MAHWIAAGSARSPVEVSLAGVRGSVGNFARRPFASRRSRLAMVLALALVAACAGGWLWFRDSSFASVQRAQISGVSGPDAPGIEAALRHAAQRMSTLDVNVGTLRAAVAGYSQVRSLRVRASFPHEMQIAVAEQLPVAVLEGPGGRRTAAAADGAVLGRALATNDLPVLPLPSLPARRVANQATLQYLTVLGAAPSPLRGLVSRVYEGPKGLTVAMREGMLVIFGDASLAHAKWLSFARVLVAEGSASAAYVDVRLPKRPAIDGGSAGAAQASPSEPQAGGEEQTGKPPASAAESQPSGTGQGAPGGSAAPAGGEQAGPGGG